MTTAKHSEESTVADLHSQIEHMKKQHASEIAALHHKQSPSATPVSAASATAKAKIAKMATKFGELQKKIDTWEPDSKFAAKDAYDLDKTAAEFMAKNVPDYEDYAADLPVTLTPVHADTLDAGKASAICAFRVKRLNEALALVP